MNVHRIGDTHLGKRFEVGVPLHRRGDRERMQWAQFEQELNANGDLIVQMGDLFDKAIVPYSVVFRAARLVREACRQNPDTTYIFLQGNHDASRDLERISAFQIFAEMTQDIENLFVVRGSPFVRDDHVFFPWDPVLTAEDMIRASASLPNAKYAYGHWDMVMGGDNQIPAKLLQTFGIVKAYTGHDHLKRELEIDGLSIDVVGSMQPYSHAEDPDGRFYVTLSLAEMIVAGDTLRDKCVRVVLEPDEVLETPPECLQLQVQRKGAEEEDIGQVAFEEFDLNELFKEACESVGLDDEFAQLALIKLDEERART